MRTTSAGVPEVIDRQGQSSRSAGSINSLIDDGSAEGADQQVVELGEGPIQCDIRRA